MVRFGTGGWRAVIGDEFTKANIQMLAKGLARKMKAEGVDRESVVIGYDRRFLSKEALVWACEALAAQGIHTLFVNRSSPTPLVMFYVEKHGLHYGLMVTASHNPAIYNGIKVFTQGGRDASEDQTSDLEGYIREAEKEGPAESVGYEEAVRKGLVTEFNPLNEYLDSIISRINMQAIRDRGLHVVLDPMYGVSQTSLKVMLSTARCELDVIHGSHDTLFGRRMPAPSEKSLTELATYVTEMNCDLGIATDGDADRVGVVDDQGRYLHANDILVMLYYYLLHYRGWRGPAVRNAATTHVLDRLAADYGQKCYEVPVGFKHISSKMAETDAIIGGESSGGLTVKGHINGKDGIYASMLLVEMIAVTGMSISQIRSAIEKKYGVHYMEERSLRFPAEKKESLMQLLEAIPSKPQPGDRNLPDFGESVDHVEWPDGCKIYFADGSWVIARFSGTEPLLRIFCEAGEKERAERICTRFEQFLRIDG